MPESRASLSQDLVWRLETLVYDTLTGMLRLLPVDWASAFGGGLFRIIGPLNGAHRTARINLQLAFPDLPPADIERLMSQQWEEVGRTFAEFGLLDRIVAGKRVEIEGIERLHAIRDSGRPVVVISGHFSNWELVAAAVVMSGIDCVITYRPANNPYMDKRFRDSRAAYGVKLFGPKGEDGARESLLALKRGVSVALMNDQKFDGGVEGTFFGHRVMTAPGPTRLAMRFGTVIQPITASRTFGARFRIHVHDPIVPDRTGDKTADIASTVAKINLMLEDRVRERPHDWFWVHKRWPSEIYKRKSSN